jgi:hypothetical protein
LPGSIPQPTSLNKTGIQAACSDILEQFWDKLAHTKLTIMENFICLLVIALIGCWALGVLPPYKKAKNLED